MCDTSTSDIQVPDDPELLKDMMRGLASVSGLYQPTAYWDFYEKRFLPELTRLGLRDFRRREHSVLDSFGAVDLPVRAKLAVGGAWPARRFMAALAASILRRLKAITGAIDGLD